MTLPAAGPLAGIRVLDLTQALAGPFATMVMADLGAEVVKVESPGGDLTRNTPPHSIDGTSLYFLANNRNKLGVVLDLKQDAAREAFYDLARCADVVISNFSAGVVERLRIDPPTLMGLNTRLIVCSITGYGRRGQGAHRRAVDPIVQSLAGAMSITGVPGTPPVRAGIPTADLSTGMYAVIAILAALNERNRTGKGCAVETSLFHSQLSLLNYMASYCAWSGDIPGPVGSGHPGTVPSQAFKTCDGWVVIDAGFDRHFRILCRIIGHPEYADDARFRTRKARAKARNELAALIAPLIERCSTQEWVEVLDAEGIPCGEVRNVAQALDSAESREYHALREVAFGGTSFKALATPLWYAQHGEHPVRAPPTLGQDTARVLATWLGYSAARIDSVMACEAP